MLRLRRQFCTANQPFADISPLLRLRHLFVGCTAFAAIMLPIVAMAQIPAAAPTPALLDTMDGQSPVLQPLNLGGGFTIGQRGIDRKSFRHGSGAERISLHGPAGRAAQLAYPLPASPVIQELRLQADLVSNRPGVQLAARVVLPRSVDRTTGRPFEILVRGDQIGAGGSWERLKLENLPQNLAKHARVARASRGASLDERGAYISQLVFLVPGGSGKTELIVDRIQVFGVVSRSPADGLPKTRQVAEPHFQAPRRPAGPSSSVAARQRRSRVPRIVRWQGEPFDALRKLGFNTISLDQPPIAEQLQQAEQLGLWLFCPPPAPQQLAEQGIAAEYEPVLAWNLGEQLSADDLELVQRWEQLVARRDPVEERPTVLAPELYSLEASRVSDVLLLGRAVVGTNLTIREHTAWLVQRQRLARPGTPIWTNIETQLSPGYRLQMAALSTQSQVRQDVNYSQMTALSSASIGVKTRGFFFDSHAALTQRDAATQRRALALELTNLRLQLAEPWITSGKELSSARSTRPELSALVMQAERSRLLVPIWWSLDMQSASHPRVKGPVSFVVPGAAESSEAFLVTLAGMQRVRHRRVTGGVRVSLDELPFDSFIMLSDDPQAIAQITRYLRRVAPRAAKLRRDLANHRLRDTWASLSAAGATVAGDEQVQRLLKSAQGELTACDGYLNAKNFELAYLRADAVDLALDELLCELREESGLTASSTQPSVDFGPVSLSDRLQLQRTLSRAPVSANLLQGGGFENLEIMLERGWRHKQLPLDGITSAVRLSPEAPHSGSYCLELEARSLDESSPATIVPTAPVWISSAPVQVRKGELLEITGVARLPQPLVGSVDGLQIMDSLGGPDMALRIQEAPSWQPFRVIRAATSDVNVSVTVALSGLGKAQIDDLAVRVIPNAKERLR